MVERDLVGNVRLASTDEFLQKLLPMRSDEVLTLSQAVKPEGFLPKDAKKESDLYTPLTQTANRILACYSGALEIHSYWATRPDHSPKHLEDDDTIALLRPDAVCVLGDIRPLLRAREQIDAFKSALKTKSKALPSLVEAILDFAVYYIASQRATPHASEISNDILKLKAELDKNRQKAVHQTLISYLSRTTTIIHQLIQSAALVETTMSGMVDQNEKWIEQLWSSLPLDTASKSDETLLAAAKKKQSKQDTTSLEALCSVWWLRIGTPVEVKLTDKAGERRSGSAQLCRYMQQILKTQFDRRFVFGLLLCKDKLRVFYCDRSGLLGTQSWIDLSSLHGYNQFIHVVLALSALDPRRYLGWDMNMQLCLRASLPHKMEFCYSTDPKVMIDDYGTTAYDTQWAIRISNLTKPEEEAWYLTTRALSLSRGEVMVGRATLVWMVKELNRDRSQVKEGTVPLVLKHAWNRSGYPTEADFVHGPGDTPTVLRHVGVIQASVKAIYTDNNGSRLDDSTESARRGLRSVSWPWKDGVFEPIGAVSIKLKGITESIGDQQVLSTSESSARSVQPLDGSSPAPRALTRTLMRTFGWPVKHFANLPELVRTLRDAIQGHNDLYFKNAVLHRDISPANILICPNMSRLEETSGCLIDLDHAKQSDKRIEYPSDALVVPRRERAVMAYYLPDDDDNKQVEMIFRRCQGDIPNSVSLAAQLQQLKECKPCEDPNQMMAAMCYPTQEKYQKWIDNPMVRRWILRLYLILAATNDLFCRSARRHGITSNVDLGKERALLRI